MKYITPEDALILAISPANVDLANSDALKLAKQVDPQMNRTLGVLTKLDLMDAGTNACEMLTNSVYPLKLGYLGVINRSQADIELNVSIEESLEAERRFFAENFAYTALRDQLGIPNLAERANGLLMDHIRLQIPKLKQKVDSQLRKRE
jgi:replication fork clamp-binding protein CrfC